MKRVRRKKLPKAAVRKLILGFLLTIALAIALWIRIDPKEEGGQLFHEIPQESTEYYPVVYIFDGDTFSVRINGRVEKVRMLGIDTPETDEKYRQKECYGPEATKRALELLKGKKVRLEADMSQPDKDRYKRLLRYVFLEDGTLVNRKLIEEGFAKEYTHQNSKYSYQKEFRAIQKEAREKQRGLWGSCSE